MVHLFESDDYLLTGIITLFLTINFNLEIGTIYCFMVIVDWVSYYIALDRKAFKLIPIEKDKRNRFVNLVWAMGAYVVFIYVANAITLRFVAAPSISAMENISQLIASTFSATPLYGSTYLRLAVWGIIIAIVESRSFFRTWLQWGIHSAGVKLPIKVFTLTALIIAGFFGAVFSVFHIVAKGITDNIALSVTFLFGVTSVLLVLHFQEVIQAIFLHIITNTIATMQQLQIGFFAPGAVGINTVGLMILGGVLLVSWLILFQQIPFIGLIKAKGA